MKIRRANPDDLAALGRLGAFLVERHHDYDANRFMAPTPQTPEGYARFLRTQLGRKDAIVLVADDDGQVTGYVYAGLEGIDYMALRGPAGAIYDIVVDPAFQQRGIGRMLLDAALEFLTQLGAPRVLLSTAQKNEAAQRLFEHAGFRRTMIEMTRESNT